MGKRLVQVTGEFLVDFCKDSNARWCYRVVDNALPEDAKLVRVMGNPSDSIITLLVESTEWPNVKPYKLLAPISIEVISDAELVRMEDDEDGKDE